MPRLLALFLCVSAIFASAQSPEKQAAIGAQMSAEFQRHTTRLLVPDASAYLERLTNRLAPQFPPINWRLRLVASDQSAGLTFEPIALPDGWLFVRSQLILNTQSEDELAGMLAHAMAHVAMFKLDPDTNTFWITPSCLGSDDPNIFLPTALLKTHRENELAAGQTALTAMSAAGFDPSALTNFLARVQNHNLPAPASGEFRSIQDQVRSAQSAVTADKQAHPVPSLLHPNNQ